MDPVISVIIPVYNVEKFIGRCLDSIVNQTYGSLDIVLIDDGSNDGSGKICEEYASRDNRIRVVHQRNKGVSAARNTGLKMSRGQYVAFIDGDDWIERDMLSYLVEILEGNDGGIAACGYYVNNESDPKLDIEAKPQCLDNETAIRMSLELKEFCFDSGVFNKLFRSDIFKKNGIEFDEEITIGEDMLCLCQCITSSNGVVYSSIPKYHVVTNDMSATRKPFNSKKASLVRAHQKLEDLVRGNYPGIIPIIRQRSAMSSYRLLCEAYANKPLHEAEAIRILQNNIKKNLAYVLKCKDVSTKNKAGLILIAVNLTLYRYADMMHEAALRLFSWKL